MIHSTAIVDSRAELADDVQVGAYSIIGANVKIGAGTTIGPHVVIKGHTSLGRDNHIYQFCSIGEDPQDKKYANEVTRLEVGDRNMIREYTSMHRGTQQDNSLTKIGNDNLFMAYTHVAHDCIIGNHVIMANGASLAGHVRLNSHAILGGFTLVHQFTQIGQYSFSAMGSSVGMERNGISAEDIRLIRKAYKMIYKMNLRLEDAIDQMEDLAGDSKELSDMVNFLRNVTRGILR